MPKPHQQRKVGSDMDPQRKDHDDETLDHHFQPRRSRRLAPQHPHNANPAMFISPKNAPSTQARPVPSARSPHPTSPRSRPARRSTMTKRSGSPPACWTATSSSELGKRTGPWDVAHSTGIPVRESARSLMALDPSLDSARVSLCPILAVQTTLGMDATTSIRRRIRTNGRLRAGNPGARESASESLVRKPK